MTQIIETKITLNETEIEKFKSLNANSVDSVLKLGQAYAELKKQHSFEDFKAVANLRELPHSKKTIERLVLIFNKAIFHDNKDKLPFRYSLLNLLASCSDEDLKTWFAENKIHSKMKTFDILSLKGKDFQKNKNLVKVTVKVSDKTDIEKLQQIRNELETHLQKVNIFINAKTLPKVA